MPEILNKINLDLKNAMRQRDQLSLNVLRMLLAAIKNKRIELLVEELTEEQVMATLSSEIKKRKDSIESYEQGGREDLAEQERKEIKILLAYQPEQMNEVGVEKIVREVISEIEGADKSKFGQIMSACMVKLKGQADGNAVKSAVEKVLGEK